MLSEAPASTPNRLSRSGSSAARCLTVDSRRESANLLRRLSCCVRQSLRLPKREMQRSFHSPLRQPCRIAREPATTLQSALTLQSSGTRLSLRSFLTPHFHVREQGSMGIATQPGRRHASIRGNSHRIRFILAPATRSFLSSTLGTISAASRSASHQAPTAAWSRHPHEPCSSVRSSLTLRARRTAYGVRFTPRYGSKQRLLHGRRLWFRCQQLALRLCPHYSFAGYVKVFALTLDTCEGFAHPCASHSCRPAAHEWVKHRCAGRRRSNAPLHHRNRLLCWVVLAFVVAPSKGVIGQNLGVPIPATPSVFTFGKSPVFKPRSLVPHHVIPCRRQVVVVASKNNVVGCAFQHQQHQPLRRRFIVPLHVSGTAPLLRPVLPNPGTGTNPVRRVSA